MKMRQRRAVALGNHPGVLSDMGRRVLDLRKAGYSNTQIARHCGCHHEQIRQLVEDPRKSPRYTTGEALIMLHENVMYGISHWGRMLKALHSHGFTYQQIALRVGVDRTFLHSIIRDPSIIPKYETGERLIDFYRAHVLADEPVPVPTVKQEWKGGGWAVTAPVKTGPSRPQYSADPLSIDA